MTGTESRSLRLNARVRWGNDEGDAGTIIETNWAGVTVKWDSRDEQHIMHNDMAGVTAS